jgi:amino acid transporter
VQAALQPLLGLTYTPASAAALTLVVLALQLGVVVASTALATRLNNVAVVFEMVGITQLSIVLLAAVLAVGHGHAANLTSTGTVPAAGWFRWLGPFMLATLLGAYTITGFESASNLAEETHEPRQVVPVTTVMSVLVSGALGMLFLVVLAISVRDVGAATASASPVAFILRENLGEGIERVFLVFMCVSIFACGMVMMVTNSRLIFAMARDGRLPGHQLLARVPRATAGPTWSSVLAAVTSATVVLVFGRNPGALTNVFTGSTLLSAILYTSTVLLFLSAARHAAREPDGFRLGRWELPVAFGALVWLAYELIVLIGPSQFRPAQTYALGALSLGLFAFGLMWLLEPVAMQSEPGASGAAALHASPDDAPPRGAYGVRTAR